MGEFSQAIYAFQYCLRVNPYNDLGTVSVTQHYSFWEIVIVLTWKRIRQLCTTKRSSRATESMWTWLLSGLPEFCSKENNIIKCTRFFRLWLLEESKIHKLTIISGWLVVDLIVSKKVWFISNLVYLRQRTLNWLLKQSKGFLSLLLKVMISMRRSIRLAV